MNLQYTYPKIHNSIQLHQAVSLGFLDVFV